MTDEEKKALKEELRKEIIADMNTGNLRSETMPYAEIIRVEMFKNTISGGEIVKSPNAGKYAVDYIIKCADNSDLSISKLFRHLTYITSGFCTIRSFEKKSSSNDYIFDVIVEPEIVGNLSHFILKHINKYLKNVNSRKEVCHVVD